jgi:hypothetical protein
MHIIELHLINFGKFSDKKIILDKQMNIIHGENEAGKSTVFYFILGMFYGFYKPYIKNRRFLEIHESLKPWSGGGYSGSLLFYDDQLELELRIERNFLQGQESVTVINEKTGEDLTDSYEIHPVFRLPDIAMRHFGISYTTFVNTLAIKQLGHETDENLEKDLKETIVNALSTHNLDVSVHKVHDKLNAELNQIGSSRRKTSTYYIKKQLIGKIKDELAKSGEIHEEIIEIKNQEKQLLHKVEDLDHLLAQLTLNQLKETLLKEENIYNQAIKLDLDNKELLNKQKDLNVNDEFTMAEIEEALERYQQQQYIANQMHGQEELIKEYRMDIDNIHVGLTKPESQVTDESLERLTKNMYKYGSNVQFINETKIEIAQKTDKLNQKEEVLNSIHQNQIKDNKNNKTGLIVSFIGLVVLLVSLAFIQTSQFVLLSAIIGIVLISAGAGLFLINRSRLKSGLYEYEGTSSEIEKAKQELAAITNTKEKKETENNEILQAYQANDLPELTSIKDKWLKESMTVASTEKMYQSQMESINKLTDKQKEVTRQLHENEKVYQQLQKNMLPIISFYQINALEEFRQVKGRLALYNTLKQEIKNQKTRISDLLGVRSLHHVENEIKNLQGQIVKLKERLQESREIDITEFEMEDESANDQIKKLTLIKTTIDKEIASLKSEIEALSRGHRNLSTIEEDLEKEEQLLQEMEFNKKVYEKIQTTIESITDELQHNFAPLLNESVSKMVETVTNSKYSDIKINPQMMMRLKDPNTHQMINMTQLSRGTMDLFYLALREALATWINKDKVLPLLFDETFAHFDDHRLSAALKMFNDADKQMILFTCQKREVDLVRIENYKNVHIINL